MTWVSVFAGAEAMVLELLLHPTSEALRRAARQLLERIADSSGCASDVTTAFGQLVPVQSKTESSTSSQPRDLPDVRQCPEMPLIYVMLIVPRTIERFNARGLAG